MGTVNMAWKKVGNIKGPQGERGDPGKETKGTDGLPGKDGVGIASAFIDREGQLIFTFTDGTVGGVGKVIGDRGTDGAPGTPGKDGFGFEDITEELAPDGRTIIRRYSRGEMKKEFAHRFGVPLDRGVYRNEIKYEQGDAVSWDGSIWIAQRDTTEKPGQGSKDWRLAVKRGRDGKDGKGERGAPGPAGKDGRDLTQMDFDGRKFG